MKRKYTLTEKALAQRQLRVAEMNAALTPEKRREAFEKGEKTRGKWRQKNKMILEMYRTILTADETP